MIDDPKLPPPEPGKHDTRVVHVCRDGTIVYQCAICGRGEFDRPPEGVCAGPPKKANE